MKCERKCEIDFSCDFATLLLHDSTRPCFCAIAKVCKSKSLRFAVCKSKSQWGCFLAGLIDADGHISQKCTSISFHKRDLEVAQHIQKYIGHGTLRLIAGKNALSYDLYGLKGTRILANLIIHKLRNPNRIVQFNTRLINRIKILKTVIDTSPLASNSWLAGFIQGDGSFQIKLTPKSGKTPFRTHVVIQIDQKTNTLLKRIQSEFGGSVGYRKFQDTYYYSSGGFSNAKRFIDYLDTHVVFGLNWDMYVLWRNAYEQVKLKNHLTITGLNQLILLKNQLSMLKATNLNLLQNQEQKVVRKDA